MKQKGKKTLKKVHLFDTPQNKSIIIGVVEKVSDEEALIYPVHRKDPFPGLRLDGKNVKKLHNNDVILYQLTEQFNLIEKIGSFDDPSIFSKIALYRHNIPFEFSDACIADAKKGCVPSPSKDREDLRHIPFVTIDGEDAKDFDDAVFAEPFNNGWRVMVAIADVSHYVETGSALDIEAKKRGNSVYFPNSVVPMLPHDLSDDLCSLKPNEDRAVLAVDIEISESGKVIAFQFMRALIKSCARLTYKQVQNTIDGKWTSRTKHLKLEIQNLFGAFKILKKASTNRGTINLFLPEYKIDFDQSRWPKKINISQDLISHHIIEEMMILANVCAAKILLKQKEPTVFRIHEAPDATRFINLSKVLKSLGLKVPSGKLSPFLFNEILKKIKGTNHETLFQELILRTQAQAKYATKNVGHFGLSLEHYCHFTSPIRRYSDLIVHRSLIHSLKLGKIKTPASEEDLIQTAEHISSTERLAATAERETFERFVIHYLKDHEGRIFEGRISGVTPNGLFIKLIDNGAEGFLSVRDLTDDFYYFDEDHHRFIGKRKKNIYQLGQSVFVKVLNANPILCTLELKIETKDERKKSHIKTNKKFKNKDIKKQKIRKLSRKNKPSS
ncbi:MAG: Ribonuclease R [Holosporales bacterium]